LSFFQVFGELLSILKQCTQDTIKKRIDEKEKKKEKKKKKIKEELKK